MGDACEYEGAYQRELTVRCGADAGLAAVSSVVAGTQKYGDFLAARVSTLAASMMDGRMPAGLVARVARAADAGAGQGRAPRMSDLAAAVRGEPEWREFQRERIARVAGMMGVSLTGADTERFMACEGVDVLRAALLEAGVPAGAPSGAPAGTPAGTPASSAATSEAGDDAALDGPAAVDEAWMAEFAAAYGREPSVHEYVRLRNLQAQTFETLACVRERHARAYAAFEATHRDYLGERLTEADFARRHLPAALGGGVAAAHRAQILASAGYRDTMRARLGALHKTLFGEALTDAECALLFERDVLSRELALQSGELNDVVVAFAEETTRLCERVAAVYRACLGREPEEAERRAALHPFRVDEAAAAERLRARLTGSLEYREVLRAEAVCRRPDLSVPAVFRLLERVLALPGLSERTPGDAVAAALDAGETL